jgi:membrane protease YdiL (CAAX protease family)
MTPSVAEHGHEHSGPFWTYTDLALFLCSILPSFALTMLGVRLIRSAVPKLFINDTVTALVFQSLMYALLLGALYLVIASKHHRPFWNSLAWTLPIPRPFLLLFTGPILAMGLSALGVVLHAPEVDSQIAKLITNRASLAELMFFGVVLAPIFEELLFRGFLFPLVAHSAGPWAGIVLTTLPFALLHGAQYAWAWQQITLIGIAGAVFGYVRYRTGTTAASSLLHAAYNATGFAGYILSRWATLN